MREIRFRAWDSKLNSWLDNYQCDMIRLMDKDNILQSVMVKYWGVRDLDLIGMAEDLSQHIKEIK